MVSNPLKELTPEEEQQMIDQLAEEIVKRKLETPAILFLESYKPLYLLGSQLFLAVAAPYLEFIGIKGYKYSALFSKMENIEKLLKKVEELIKKDKESKTQSSAQ